MKKEIHPKYVECKVTCGCGNSWTTRSTRPELHIEICSNCHPFFTGQQKFVDTAGRVERFQKKYAWDAKKVLQGKPKSAAAGTNKGAGNNKQGKPAPAKKKPQET